MHQFSATAVAVCFVLALGCGRTNRQTEPQEVVAAADTVRTMQDGFTGSQACADCHGAITETYQQHSMGRSAQRLTAATPLPKLERASFDAGRFRYAVRRRNDQWVHHQGRITDENTETAEIDLVVQHMIGSGAHGQSYLVDHDGYLFMSPITWYPGKQIWDLSPGYEKNNSQFNRPIIEQCLYCHTNGSPAVVNHLNRFDPPFARGHAIGCERCHGPGAAHVEKQSNLETNEGADSTIVNPGKLPADLREAVCQQCHLSGSIRVTKPGKSLYDYQPGSPLESAYTVFVADQGGESRFVGHVEQMHRSACFRGSDGQLGCISCHDPHQLPSRDERVAFYRGRCMACHTSSPCSETTEVREGVGNNCVTCHMPPLATEVRHAAITDHSIPRSPGSQRASEKTGHSLFAFPSNQVAKPTPRDRAIALVRLASRDRNRFPPSQLAEAQRALEATARTDPQDFDALDALADLQLASGDARGAMSLCLQTLSRVPRREQTLVMLAETHSKLNNFEQAIPFWKQAVQVNPWMAKYWYRLGQAYAASGQWFVCRQIATDAKARFPTSVGVRHLLVQSNLELGDADAAKREYLELERFDPPGMSSIRSWYREQTQSTLTRSAGE